VNSPWQHLPDILLTMFEMHLDAEFLVQVLGKVLSRIY
jgi:hypothetical protein